MKGDIIFVERRPLLWRSTEDRRNKNSKKMDIAIYRMTKYTHYGIDLGKGRVAHFQADSYWDRHNSTIVEASMEEFVKDGHVKVLEGIEYLYSRDEVVKRAYQLIGSNFGGYSILDNNCEHFALWCATGSKDARQYVLLKSGIQTVSRPIISVSRPIAPISRKMLAFATGKLRF